MPLDPPFKLPRPDEYDVCISDITAEYLNCLGRDTEHPYLESMDFPEQPFPVEGSFLNYNRFMVPLACCSARLGSPVLRVWFLLDTASPYTYISNETINKLYGQGNAFSGFGRLHIQKKNVTVEGYKSNEKFKEVNILGLDAIQRLQVNNIHIDWSTKKFVISSNEK